MKKILLLLVIALLLASCATMSSMMKADSKMKSVEVNMTKEEVVAIIGKSYEVVNRTKDTFTLGYKSYDDGIYMLYFVDGLLKEWNKEWLIERHKVVHTISNEEPN